MKTLIIIAVLTIWMLSKVAGSGLLKKRPNTAMEASSMGGEDENQRQEYEQDVSEVSDYQKPSYEKPFSYEDVDADFATIEEPVIAGTDVVGGQSEHRRFDLREAVVYSTLLQNKYINTEN